MAPTYYLGMEKCSHEHASPTCLISKFVVSEKQPFINYISIELYVKQCPAGAANQLELTASVV